MTGTATGIGGRTGYRGRKGSKGKSKEYGTVEEETVSVKERCGRKAREKEDGKKSWSVEWGRLERRKVKGKVEL